MRLICSMKNSLYLWNVSASHAYCLASFFLLTKQKQTVCFFSFFFLKNVLFWLMSGQSSGSSMENAFHFLPLITQHILLPWQTKRRPWLIVQRPCNDNGYGNKCTFCVCIYTSAERQETLCIASANPNISTAAILTPRPFVLLPVHCLHVHLI